MITAFEFVGRYNYIVYVDRCKIHRDGDSPYRDTFTMNLEKVSRFRKNKSILNIDGMEEKEIYRTLDVYKLLKIIPYAFRLRLYRGIWQDNYQTEGLGRIFTTHDLERLKKVNQR